MQIDNVLTSLNHWVKTRAEADMLTFDGGKDPYSQGSIKYQKCPHKIAWIFPCPCGKQVGSIGVPQGQKDEESLM